MERPSDDDDDDDDATTLVAAASDGARRAPRFDRTTSPFGPVVLSVTDQMALVCGIAHARLVRAGTARDDDDGDDDDDEKNASSILLVRSTPARWITGGYAAHHYVPEPPQPHGLCYEASMAIGGGLGGEGVPNASRRRRARVGYIAVRRVLVSHWSPYDRVRDVDADP